MNEGMAVPPRRTIPHYYGDTVRVLFFAGAVLLYWTLRPNRAQVDPSLEIEVWTAVRSGMHDSNTDLMRWQGQLYLVHARSAHHLGTADARLVLWPTGPGLLREVLMHRVAVLADQQPSQATRTRLNSIGAF